MLAAVAGHRNPAFIVLALLTALLSALYMARAMFVPFFGRLRQEMEHVQESPASMIVPMALLAVLAAGFGFISFNWPGSYDGVGSFVFFHERESFHFTWWLGILSAVLAVGAFVFAYLVYLRKSLSVEGLRGSVPWLVRLMENKYYFDEVYQWVVDRIVLVFANFLGTFDRAFVNDIVVNGPADTVRHLGVALRLHVTGHVYSYLLAMVLGAVVFGIFWWLMAAW